MLKHLLTVWNSARHFLDESQTVEYSATFLLISKETRFFFPPDTKAFFSLVLIIEVCFPFLPQKIGLSLR